MALTAAFYSLVTFCFFKDNKSKVLRLKQIGKGEKVIFQTQSTASKSEIATSITLKTKLPLNPINESNVEDDELTLPTAKEENITKEIESATRIYQRNDLKIISGKSSFHFRMNSEAQNFKTDQLEPEISHRSPSSERVSPTKFLLSPRESEYQFSEEKVGSVE